MDSVTQIALGAAVSHTVLGRHIGRRALIIGAVLGTLPDMDVLVRYDDAVANFTYHRSWSHSLFVLSLASVPIAWLMSRLWRQEAIPLGRWWLGCWLILITHALLDGFTIYGTQLFWPLPMPPVSIGSIFIIDPLYTLPLIIGVICAWRWQSQRGRKAVATALVISCVYLSWTLVAQHLTHQRVQRQLVLDGINARKLIIAPFPTTLLWRAVVIDDNRYLEGFTSLLDSRDSVRLTEFDDGRKTFVDWLNHWPVKRLDWFTEGAIALLEEGGELIVTDLRMGIENSYVFRFSVADLVNRPNQKLTSRQLPFQFDTERVKLLLQRISDQEVIVSPVN